MKVFIINLEKDKLRKEHMQRLCSDLELDYRIISAIDGDTINEQTNSVHKNYRPLGKNEKGCILSHQKVYNIILKEKIPFSIILEDDVDLSSKLKEVVNKIIKIISFDIVLLGYHKGRKEIMTLKDNPVVIDSSGFSLYKLQEVVYGSYGYIISLEGAKKIVEKSLEMKIPMDHYITDYHNDNIICVYPQLVFIHHSLSEQSNIQEEREILSKKYTIEQQDKYLEILSKAIDLSKNDIVIYGINELGKSVFKKYKNRVKGMIDKNMDGELFDGCHIYNILNFSIVQHDITFVITAINETYISEIQSNILNKFPDVSIINVLD